MQLKETQASSFKTKNCILGALLFGLAQAFSNDAAETEVCMSFSKNKNISK